MTTYFDAPEPADPAAIVDHLAPTSDCSPDGLGFAIGTDLLPAVPDPPAEPAPDDDVQNLPNEPATAGDDRPIAAEEATATLGDDRILTNEPSPGSAPVGRTDLMEEAGWNPEAHVCDGGLGALSLASAGNLRSSVVKPRSTLVRAATVARWSPPQSREGPLA
jgi:hypothetical protein